MAALFQEHLPGPLRSGSGGRSYTTGADTTPAAPGGYYTDDGLWASPPFSPVPVVEAQDGVFVRVNDTDLYPWETTVVVPDAFWDRGAVGHQLFVRAMDGDDRTLVTFESGTDVAGCADDAPGWNSFVDQCVSDQSPVVRIQTQNFIPWWKGGLTCDATVCDSCIPDVVSALNDTFSDNAGSANQNLRLNISTSASRLNHIQGYARLPDVEVQTEQGPVLDGRIIASRDRPPQLYVFRQFVFVPDSTPLLDGSDGFLESFVDLAGLGVHDHPGGVGTAGEYVAVPMECSETGDCQSAAAVVHIFDAQSGTELQHLHTLELDGDMAQPDPYVPRGWAAATDLVRTRDGRYLLFVAGRRSGAAGGFFYVSSETELSAGTTWDFVDWWTPECSDPRRDECWAGANNVSFIKQCDGEIFLVGLNGEAGLGEVISWASVFRIDQAAGSREIEPSFVERYNVDTADILGIGDASFRWGATATPTPDGRVVVEATERDLNGTGNLTTLSVGKFRPLP